jgi:hypothetical protein
MRKDGETVRTRKKKKKVYAPSAIRMATYPGWCQRTPWERVRLENPRILGTDKMENLLEQSSV